VVDHTLYVNPDDGVDRARRGRPIASRAAKAAPEPAPAPTPDAPTPDASTPSGG
jgi:hypothetical protein